LRITTQTDGTTSRSKFVHQRQYSILTLLFVSLVEVLAT
jgi:hypothetical protein